MSSEALELARWESSHRATTTEYRPRRAIVEVVGLNDGSATGRTEIPAFKPGGSAESIPRTQWTAPVGPPVVEDLASSQPCREAADARSVARELDRLNAADGRWVCLNSIPGGKKGTEIDHLVIGPGGVFTVNAGRDTNGHSWTGGDIRASRYEAERVAERLTATTRISVRVQGLIVPVGAIKDVVKQPSNVVRIVNQSALVDYLRDQPPYLDGQTRARIIGYARLSSTWSN